MFRHVIDIVCVSEKLLEIFTLGLQKEEHSVRIKVNFKKEKKLTCTLRHKETRDPCDCCRPH